VEGVRVEEQIRDGRAQHRACGEAPLGTVVVFGDLKTDQGYL